MFHMYKSYWFHAVCFSNLPVETVPDRSFQVCSLSMFYTLAFDHLDCKISYSNLLLLRKYKYNG